MPNATLLVINLSISALIFLYSVETESIFFEYMPLYTLSSVKSIYFKVEVKTHNPILLKKYLSKSKFSDFIISFVLMMFSTFYINSIFLMLKFLCSSIDSDDSVDSL